MGGNVVVPRPLLSSRSQTGAWPTNITQDSPRQRVNNFEGASLRKQRRAQMGVWRGGMHRRSKLHQTHTNVGYRASTAVYFVSRLPTFT
jgi:hypothetical protein